MVAHSIIINADDCGISKVVDKEIERCIRERKITSTTIMANMPDFEGAVHLYKQYSNEISFGWHMNLDEGESLTKSQLLLDKGLFVEKEGRSMLNGSALRRMLLGPEVKKDIKKELKAQYERLKDNGIEITHVDSHHFYHTRPDMVQIFPAFFCELKIKKCRHLYNYGVTGINRIARSLWDAYFKLYGMKMPDTFCFFKDFYNNPRIEQKGITELMIHPGHPKPDYDDEYKMMLQADYSSIWPDVHLISYNDF